MMVHFHNLTAVGQTYMRIGYIRMHYPVYNGYMHVRILRSALASLAYCEISESISARYENHDTLYLNIVNHLFI